MTDSLALAVAGQPPDNGVRIGVVTGLGSGSVTVDVGGASMSAGLLNGVRPRVGAVVALIRQASTWLLLGTVQDPAATGEFLAPICKIYQNAAQSFSNGATTPFDFDTLQFDTTGGQMWNAGTPGTIIVPQDGYYLPFGGGGWASNATGGRGVLPTINGANQNGGWSKMQAANGVSTQVPIRAQPEPLHEGDLVGLNGFQGSGGSLNSSVGTTAERPTLGLAFLRPL